MKNKNIFYGFLLISISIGIGLYLISNQGIKPKFSKFLYHKKNSNSLVGNQVLKKEKLISKRSFRRPASVTQKQEAVKLRPSIGPLRPGLRGQKPRRTNGNNMGSDPRIKEVNEGINFEMNGRGYTILDNAFAIKTEDFQSDRQQVLVEKPGYLIVASDEMPSGDFQQVVKNNDSGNLAIFTGKLRVKLFDTDQIGEVIARVNEINSTYTINPTIDDKLGYIKVVSLQFDDYQETMDFYNTAKTPEFDDLILRINIDLIEWERTEN